MDLKNFYIAENILDWPGQLAVVKLSDPQLFVKFDYNESYFASFEDFRDSIVTMEWLSGERPAEKDIDRILTDCWNFLALTEEEEERLADERDEDDF